MYVRSLYAHYFEMDPDNRAPLTRVLNVNLSIMELKESKLRKERVEL